MKRLALFCSLLIMLASSLAVVAQTTIADGVPTQPETTTDPDRGVARTLAEARRSAISDVAYRLQLSIPDSTSQPALGQAVITFRLAEPQEVVIDFFDPANLRRVSVAHRVVNEHIVLPREVTVAGLNSVSIDFVANQRLLNRRPQLLYTLSVPDKARRLFPCFDQPDIKATYTLALTMPEGWSAVSNGAVASTVSEGGRTTVRFAPTEPLSTYLFAFAAGAMERRSMTKAGRTIALYHCETDSARLAQCDDILREVFASLEWVEDYTGIPYPFAKYDLIIVPGFQFGGMEHTGATLYNDRVLFLTPQATLDERLARTALIAHETAHMWFGDYLTMHWFGEVWTKEVFANYYAAQMSEPLYPDVDHRLRFMLSYAASSYAEDRTAGANPIQQQLDNLQDAGLVYGNIIYDKSPMMMRQLVGKIGAETFREGISRYLRQHAYGNATWDDLISILDSLTTEDLRAWSTQWVDGVGMPVYCIARKGRTLTIRQEGPIHPQQVSFLVDGQLLTADCSGSTATLRLPAKARSIVPNADGMAYGYFALDDNLLAASLAALDSDDDLARGATLINLHEALWRGDIVANDYTRRLAERLSHEQNPLLFSLTASQLRTAHSRYAEGADRPLEDVLLTLLRTDSVPSRKVTALRALADVMDSPEAIDAVYQLWGGKAVIDGFRPSDLDAMNLALQLAVRLPQQADAILAEQRSRLAGNANLLAEFDFVAPALSPRQADRDSLFELLLTPAGRQVEPWAESALYYLNHRYRREEGMRYVHRGLEAVEDVKRTGDIFFPKRWVSMLLAGQRPDDAARVVRAFLAEHPDYPPMLRRKILMNIF